MSSKKTRAVVKAPSPDSTDEDSDQDDDGIDLKEIQKTLVILTKAIGKKYGSKTTNTQLRYTSGSKKKERNDWAEKRGGEARRVEEERKYDDGEKMDAPTKCFNCGKPGHYARECRLPKNSDTDYYRRKPHLSKQRDKGKALLVEDDHWLNQSSLDDSKDEDLELMAYESDSDHQD